MSPAYLNTGSLVIAIGWTMIMFTMASFGLICPLAATILHIHAHRDLWPITILCRVLRVTTSGYYAWRRRPGSPRLEQDDRLCHTIRALYRQHQGAYGVPRITRELRFMGHRANRKRVARLMREMSLQGIQMRRFKPRTTIPNTLYDPAPRLRRRRLNAESATALLAEWGASGLSAADFAAEQGISARTLHRWRHQLAR